MTLKAGSAKQDKLVLQYAEVAPEEQDPQAPFHLPGQYFDTTLPLIVSVPRAGEQQPAEV